MSVQKFSEIHAVSNKFNICQRFFAWFMQCSVQAGMPSLGLCGCAGAHSGAVSRDSSLRYMSLLLLSPDAEPRL